MAPDLAMERLKNVRRGALVLDPMAGSGTVLRQATELGHRALGFDMDPLAVLMAKVWTRPLDGAAVDRLTDQVIAEARGADAAGRQLDWIDDDPETAAFVEYWFADPQRSDLRRLAGALARLEGGSVSRSDRKAAADVLRLAVSRIIITKDQGISLARDTSHSRPHKVADASSVAVFSAFERSVRQLRRLLDGAPPKGGCEVELGDARALRSVENGVVDAVLTSPPYLNAIDYMRGHRLSLVWLGYRLSDLRKIRSESIGAERAAEGLFDGMLEAMGAGDGDSMSGRHRGMVERYCEDVYRLMSEMARVLKSDGKAFLIVGNSCLKGQFIRNSEGVRRAGKMVGLRLRAKIERELPHRNRYLPMPAAGEGPLGKRMRTETILTFSPA
jgi:SAM-dependent methyltransferase